MEGSPSVSALDDKNQVDLPFSDDNIVLRAMAAYSKYAVLVCVCSKDPLEVWEACAGSRINVFGRPETTQMDLAGELGNGMWAALCPVRNIRSQFQGKGAHPWLVER